MSDSKFTTHGDEPVEARIVAWVLGEASAFEAEELERLCEERPELAVFKRRIEAVHGLAQEAHDHKEDARWKLSIQKRSPIEELIGAEEEAAEDLARDLRAGRSGRRAMLAIAACLVMTLVVATLTWPIIFQRVGYGMKSSAAQESMMMEMDEADGDAVFFSYSAVDSKESNEKLGKKLKEYKSDSPVADRIRSAPPELAVPVPEVELAKPSVNFGANKDFGEGWSAAAAGGESDSLVAERRREKAAPAKSPAIAPVPTAAPTPKVQTSAIVDEIALAPNENAPVESVPKGLRGRANSTLPAPDPGLDAQMSKDEESIKAKGSNTLNRLATRRATSRDHYYRSESIQGGADFNGPAPAFESEPMAPEKPNSVTNGVLGGLIPGQSQAGESSFDDLAGGQPARGGRSDQFKNTPDLAPNVDQESPEDVAGFRYQRSLAETGKEGLVEVDALKKSLDKLEADTANSLTHVEQKKLLAEGKQMLEMRKLVEASEIELSSQTERLDEDGRRNYAWWAGDEGQKAEIITKYAQSLQNNEKELGFDWLLEEGELADADKDRGLSALAKREMLRRQNDVVEADQELLNGRDAFLGGDYEGALNRFKGALQKTPDAPLFADRREAYEAHIKLAEKALEVAATDKTDEERKRPVPTGEEIIAADEPYSTFSLNINDASFRVAQSALAKGEMPDPTGIKVEQFYNAVNYGDPAPAQGQPVAGSIEQAAHPVIPGRNLVRVAIKTASEGRNQGQPLRLTLLIDQSGSMAREDRRQAMVDALEGLRGLLNENDQVNVIGFSRTPRLLAEAVNGKEGQLANLVNIEANEGGTNLEEALKLGEQLAERHQLEGAQNRMVLFTDGAANLGDADPDSLSDKIKELRQKGISFDIAGIVADGLNDELLGEMARHGNGRYYVVGKGGKNRFAEQLAGAFSPAAENVKVQVHFNPERVGRYKLIGFEKDRLNKEDFHDDTVDAAEMAAEEAGVAIYQVETLPEGEGEIGEVSVRFRDVASGEMVERSWTISNEISTAALDQARPSMQLATLAMMAGQKLKGGPLADAINFNDMGEVIAKVNQHYKGDPKAAEMLEMIEQLK